MFAILFNLVNIYGIKTFISLLETDCDLGDTEASLEGWLQTPSKQNIRRHGWKKLYVVVSKRKIIFFNSEMDKQNSDPALILDLNKVKKSFFKIRILFLLRIYKIHQDNFLSLFLILGFYPSYNTI